MTKAHRRGKMDMEFVIITGLSGAGKSRGCNSMIRQDVIHTYSLQETLEPCP